MQQRQRYRRGFKLRMAMGISRPSVGCARRQLFARLTSPHTRTVLGTGDTFHIAFNLRRLNADFWLSSLQDLNLRELKPAVKASCLGASLMKNVLQGVWQRANRPRSREELGAQARPSWRLERRTAAVTEDFRHTSW